MKKVLFGLIAGLALAFASTVASAQQQWPGDLLYTYSPNTYPTAQTFTATSQTGATLTLAGHKSGVIQIIGTALTTATWEIDGSIDGGVTFFQLPTAAYPTTTFAAPSGAASMALTQTTTANNQYVVNLVGLSAVRFKTSGTFTATNIKIQFSASRYPGYL